MQLNPSTTPPFPVFSAIVQPLPFTSTQESAAVMPAPANLFFRSVPPVVPSLMSTASAVVSEMSLSSTTLRSLRSGAQAVSSHQLLWALPT